MALHTNNRKLDFHPHIHVVVPGGGVNKRRRQWKKYGATVLEAPISTELFGDS
ncbi:MAG: transposase [Deltaproteobacteria bacterium]|nr:transposase [Deltaproteobacteria bacterium]